MLIASKILLVKYNIGMIDDASGISICTDFNFSDFAHLPKLLHKTGIDRYDFGAIIVAGIILLIVSLVQEKKGIEIREWIMERKTPLRWTIIYICLLVVIVFGYYGTGANPADFVYMQF